MNNNLFGTISCALTRDPKEVLNNNLSEKFFFILTDKAALFRRKRKVNRDFFLSNPKDQTNFLVSKSLRKGSGNRISYRSYACLRSSEDIFMQRHFFGQLDERYFDFVSRVYNDALKIDPSLSEEATKIFTFMGCSPSPMLAPPPSSSLTRLEIGLSDNPGNEFLEFMKKFLGLFIKNFMKRRADTPFKIGSQGNPGFPDFVSVSDILISKYENPYFENTFREFKKAQIIDQNSFFLSNEFQDTLISGDLEQLFLNYGMIFFYTDQHRGQPDRFDKERKGFDIEMWISKEKNKNIENFYRTQDKKRNLKEYFGRYNHLFKTYENFEISCKKNRLVFAMSSSTNTCVNLIFSHFRKNYGDELSFTYKCSDKDNLQESVNSFIDRFSVILSDYDIFTFDVSNYDNSISPQMNVEYCRAFYDFNELLGSIMIANSSAPGAMRGPFFGPSQKASRNHTVMLGNCFDPSSFMFSISPSGVADVTERAKLICSSFVLFYAVNSLKESSKTDQQVVDSIVLDILKGNNPLFAFFNLGDNNFIIAHKNLHIREKLQNSNIFKIDISKEGFFGGLQIKINYKENKIEVKDSAVSTLIKMLSPERPIDDPLHSSYDLGIINRYEKARSNNIIGNILDSIDRNMYDMFRCDSQINICRKRIQEGAVDSSKSIIYEDLSRFLSLFGVENLSKFFLDIVESGGDKLFYTDLYDQCSEKEKKMLDNLFFSVLKDEECSNVIGGLGLQ